MTNELTKELSLNFINYAVAVNTDRAIPDATSGLKPVARRILYGAYEGGRSSSKPHVKCARIVGDVMGSLHPHGDSSIYEALVRLSQEWVMRYPLIDFHGNKGNIGGDGPAASRYTEARLAPISEQGLLSGLKKKNVPFIPNYDESSEEPSTLPAIFPNLLCNPNMGIGVALACNWLPHNLCDVAKAINDYIEGKEPMLPGPDFPTGGIIINKDDIPAIMKSGKGSVIVRGKYKIEGKNIIFYEIPYGISTESLLAEIGSLCDEKEIEGITNIQDESTLHGLRIVIKCDRSATPEKIVNQLFAKSSLQTAISYNQVALVDRVPVELNLKDAIKIYLSHNENCLIKETEYNRDEARDRLEIVDGLLKALEDIDNIIALIKASESSKDAIVRLTEKYHFTENQAKAIVNMKLGSLAGLEKIELQNEANELNSALTEYENILSIKEKRIKIIQERLDTIVKKFGDKRKTDLEQISTTKKSTEEKKIESIEPENCVITLNQDGYIKRISASTFKPQNRNGKGVKGGDKLIETISTNTIDTILFFTSLGRMYRILANDIPKTENTEKGTSVEKIFSLGKNENIISMTSLHRNTSAEYVLFFTTNGLIKKTSLSEYCGERSVKSGIQAIKINDNDSIANVTFVKDEDALVITKNGMCIRFETKDIAAVGRTSTGIRAIKLEDGDSVFCGIPISSSTETIGLFTSKGWGKRVSISEFTSQGRGGKGVCCYKVARGEVVGAHTLKNNDKIVLMGTNNICISAKDVPIVSRIAQGNSMIQNSTITGTVKI